MWRATLFAHMLILAWPFTGSVAHAQSSEELARGHYTLARAQYEAGQFEDAAREFQAAYDAAPRPQLLYNIYLAHRDGGHAEQAAAALRGYVATLEDSPTKTQLTARLRALERVVAERASADAHQQPSSDAAAGEDTRGEAPPDDHGVGADAQGADDAAGVDAAVTTAPDSSADSPRTEGSASSSSAPWMVVGTGAGLALVGAVVGAFALRAQKDLEDACPDRTACDPGTWRRIRDRGRRLALTADALWIGGAAVSVAGLLWVLLRRPAERLSASALCTGDGCALSVQGSF